MGKGTLIVSPTTFALRALKADPCLTGDYIGNVLVSCNDEDDPNGASPYPLVQRPLPTDPVYRHGDFVLFEYVPLLPGHGRCRHTVRLVDHVRRNDCAEKELVLQVSLGKLNLTPKLVKKPSPGKVKKAAKKKK